MRTVKLYPNHSFDAEFPAARRAAVLAVLSVCESDAPLAGLDRSTFARPDSPHSVMRRGESAAIDPLQHHLSGSQFSRYRRRDNSGAQIRPRPWTAQADQAGRSGDPAATVQRGHAGESRLVMRSTLPDATTAVVAGHVYRHLQRSIDHKRCRSFGELFDCSMTNGPCFSNIAQIFDLRSPTQFSSSSCYANFTFTTSPVPLPGGLFLFGTALGGLAFVRRYLG